jgi:hypothetical protein
MTPNDGPLTDAPERSPATEASRASGAPRPGRVCAELLAAVDASEGRRKRRARNTTADAIGLEIKRQLLEEVVRADPEPDDFEGWLLERCQREGAADGPVRAMALVIWDEWRLASTTAEFRRWLEEGAPSADREGTLTPERRHDARQHDAR